jgi:hypothetical protein
VSGHHPHTTQTRRGGVLAWPARLAGVVSCAFWWQVGQLDSQHSNLDFILMKFEKPRPDLDIIHLTSPAMMDDEKEHDTVISVFAIVGYYIQ